MPIKNTHLPQGRADSPVRKPKGISGSVLKLIATITMLIDHIGAGVLAKYMAMDGVYGNVVAMEQWIMQNEQFYTAYSRTRMIGRIAFPIYCFLLVQGFIHTKNRKKYAGRLFLFAIISEIPFDLLFSAVPLEIAHQNVFFTLLIGFLTMAGLDWVHECPKLNIVIRIPINLIIVFGCMALAVAMRTDYGGIGVASIVILYLFRRKKKKQIVAGCITFLWEVTAPLAFIPIGFYNGERGWNLKYFFYLFYPVHLLLLYLLCVALGIGSIAVLS